MADNYQQNPDGSWSPAEPIPDSRQIKVEKWLRRHHLTPVANLLVWWDERKLGR